MTYEEAKALFDEDLCVSCGEIIPEGRMVCRACEEMALKDWLYSDIDETIDCWSDDNAFN